MTANVKIENGTAPYRVRVQSEDRDASGQWKPVGPAVVLEPGAELPRIAVWDSRRLVIEEVERVPEIEA